MQQFHDIVMKNRNAFGQAGAASGGGIAAMGGGFSRGAQMDAQQAQALVEKDKHAKALAQRQSMMESLSGANAPAWMQSMSQGERGYLQNNPALFDKLMQSQFEQSMKPQKTFTPDLETKYNEQGLAQKFYFDEGGQEVNVGGAQAPKGGFSITQNPDGTTTITQGGQSKKLTESQSKATVFSNSANQAEEAISSVLDSGYNPALDILSQEARGALPQGWQSEQQKLYESAKMGWIMPILRYESGAVIGDSEIANFDKVYFPQAGDSAAVIAAKKKARKSKLDGVITASGGGFETLQKNKSPAAKGIDKKYPEGTIIFNQKTNETKVMRGGKWVTQ